MILKSDESKERKYNYTPHHAGWAGAHHSTASVQHNMHPPEGVCDTRAVPF